MKKVSVIIPVYNDEGLIRRCIESLLRQSYKDTELIIVDDGSDDSTEIICRKFADKNNSVIYHRMKHKGVSSVRNYGLSVCSGDYVMFVDSDDYAANDLIEKMVNGLEEYGDCDMCMCSYMRVIYNNFYPIAKLQSSGMVNRDTYLLNTLKDPGHHYFGVLWNKIFRRKIIMENSIRFHEDITLGEDFVFSLEYLQFVNKINVLDDRLYYYCYHQRDSLSRIDNKKYSDCRTEMFNRNKIFERYVKSFRCIGLFEKEKKRIYHYWVVFYIRQKYGMRMEYRWDEDTAQKWRREILQNPYIKEAILLHGRGAVTVEYTRYFMLQTMRNIMKHYIKILHKPSL